MMRRVVSLILLVLVLIGAYILFRTPGVAGAGQNNQSTSRRPADQPMPHQIDFPYYSLRDAFDSIRFLVSDSPKPLQFVAAVRSLTGRTHELAAMTIQPQAKLRLDLGTLLRGAGLDITGEFTEGSVSVHYVANGLMPLVGQVTIVNSALSLVSQWQMVGNDPRMPDVPPVLNGLWWDLSAGRDATIMVSNTAGEPAIADVFLDFHGARHSGRALQFAPHETKTLSVPHLLSDLNLSPAQVPEGGITIVARGPKPTLIAQGRIIDPTTGFSTTLHFPLPQRQRSSAVHATGVPIGTPTADSPFAGAGSFTPHVIVRNLSASPQTVTLTLEYPGNKGPAQAELGTVSLAAYSTQDIPLESRRGGTAAAFALLLDSDSVQWPAGISHRRGLEHPSQWEPGD